MLRKEGIEALHKMELAEQTRSDKFDRQWNREVAKLDNKNSIVVQQQRAKLHQVKETEMTRRMKWGAAWVAREHKLLYGRADASEHFNEYMADMAHREGQLDALGDTRYRKASEVIGSGKVAAQTKALMGAVDAFKRGIKKPSRTEAYVVTWKRAKKLSSTRPYIMSGMSDDEEFGFLKHMQTKDWLIPRERVRQMTQSYAAGTNFMEVRAALQGPKPNRVYMWTAFEATTSGTYETATPFRLDHANRGDAAI